MNNAIATIDPLVDRDAWLEARKGSVGASEVAALPARVTHPYDLTKLRLYRLKMGLEEYDLASPDMERGIYLEDDALDYFARETGLALGPGGFFVHREEEHASATPDATVPEEDATVEVKVVRWGKFKSLVDNGLNDGWIVQKQMQLEVCDASHGYFTFLNADSWRLVQFKVERNRDIGGPLIEACNLFWEYILRGEPPEDLDLKVELPDITAIGGELVQMDGDEWARLTRDFEDAREVKAMGEALYDQSKRNIQEFLAAELEAKRLESEHGVFEGAGWRFHNKMQKGRKTFKPKELEIAKPVDRELLFALLAANPDVAAAVQTLVQGHDISLDLEQFYKQGAEFRVFRPYPMKQVAEGKSKDEQIEGDQPPLQLVDAIKT